jgi:hypothetical protein
MTSDRIVETNDRFPSGPWTGFFLQKAHPGRNWMKLELTFAEGKIVGTGSDWVGKFVVEGTYDVESGLCIMTKGYLGRHTLNYRGYNEGKGIWGTWRLESVDHGGFYIWPEGMPDPTQPRLAEEADLPRVLSIEDEPSEEALVRPARGRGGRAH